MGNIKSFLFNVKKLDDFCFKFMKVAGTEEGVKEPRATFSACFGAAFIMLHPTKYAAMLASKMEKHGATGWLVNTGWSGGRYYIIYKVINTSCFVGKNGFKDTYFESLYIFVAMVLVVE